MKAIVCFSLSLFLVSCSHQHRSYQSKKSTWSWLTSSSSTSSSRIPAQSKSFKDLEEYLQAFSKAHLNTVPVGHEVVESDFRNGETWTTRTIYLKQSEYGYFKILLDGNDVDLVASNLQSDFREYEAAFRQSVSEGRLKKITKVRDGVYSFEAIDDSNNSCFGKEDFNLGTSLSICRNTHGEVVAKSEKIQKKVDVTDYKSMLRKKELMICSNIFYDEQGTDCHRLHEDDWWAYLFEKDKES